jgi:hypothetical protein
MSSMSMTPADQGGVAYEVTFEPMWTSATHPLEYPKSTLLSAPHFSGLIGASHADGYALFAPGALPTPGLERLSEEGKHAPLDAEIQAAIAAGKAGSLFESDPIKDLSMPASATVTVSDAFPMVSVVAMIAPSPDWFAGAAGVRLIEGGKPVASKQVTVFAHDSGGDDGTTYTAADADTMPKQATRLLDSPHFLQAGKRVPVGTLSFRRK